MYNYVFCLETLQNEHYESKCYIDIIKNEKSIENIKHLLLECSNILPDTINYGELLCEVFPAHYIEINTILNELKEHYAIILSKLQCILI